MNAIFGAGAAALSGGAAIQSQPTASNKSLTALLAGIGAICVFVAGAFKFGGRFAGECNCPVDLDQAFAKYQTDTSLDDKWLGEQVAKAP